MIGFKRHDTGVRLMEIIEKPGMSIALSVVSCVYVQRTQLLIGSS
jgi:hypothetical protein